MNIGAAISKGTPKPVLEVMTLHTVRIDLQNDREMKRVLEHELPSSSTGDGLQTVSHKRTGVCTRQPLHTHNKRDVHLVYTDIFLDSFNYTKDYESLWDGVLEMDDADNKLKVLIVLSPLLYNTIKTNENNVVLEGGRCFITTAADFGSIGDETYRPPSRFDHVVYFNVDPFVHSSPTGSITTNTLSTVAAVVRTPFVAAFDIYMTSPEAVENTTVTIMTNTFLMRTDRVIQYERSRNVNVVFKTRVFPVHSYTQEVITRTACNFCSEMVTCLQPDMEVYTVSPDHQIPSLRSLGPAVAGSMNAHDHLVLLDISANVGGNANANEYYRFKHFYFSFAHDRKNKWGLVLEPGQPLSTYLRRWNTLVQEEMKRWYWVLNREAECLPREIRPTRNDLRMRIMQVYAMCPCILNGVNVDRDVCVIHPPTAGAIQTEPAASVNQGSYIKDVLMRRYDTSCLAPGGDTNDPLVVKPLLAAQISVNEELIVENIWPDCSHHVKHNRFCQDLTGSGTTSQ